MKFFTTFLALTWKRSLGDMAPATEVAVEAVVEPVPWPLLLRLPRPAAGALPLPLALPRRAGFGPGEADLGGDRAALGERGDLGDDLGDRGARCRSSAGARRTRVREDTSSSSSRGACLQREIANGENGQG